MCGNLPADFEEGEINFGPTYKINEKFQTYNFKWIPGWTDRILYKSKDNWLNQVRYDSLTTVLTSDHRPVFAQFEFDFSYEFKE